MSRIYGINTLKDSLDLNRVKKVYLAKEFKDEKILKLIEDKKVQAIRVDKKELDKLSNKGVHQGVVAEITDFKTYQLSDVIKARKDNSIICILDELTDPHNLGAILRSADIFNIEAIIYKKRNSVSLSPLVAKISVGAINYVKCVEVVNLTRAIKELKNNGYWIIGLAGEAKVELKDAFKDRPLAVIIGNEGDGISRLVKENCDLLVKIPQFGHVPCLNASNAAAITFYELRRK